MEVRQSQTFFMSAVIYLIPNFIAQSPLAQTFPAYNAEILSQIQHFFVEDLRSARRFIKQMLPAAAIDSLNFYGIGKHDDIVEAQKNLEICRASAQVVGLISESGYPCLADPGAALLSAAHEKAWQIVPLVGPSSLFMALAASGLNGQKFTFHGYLPIDKNEKKAVLHKMQAQIQKEQATQIFIEAPFRNDILLQFLLDEMHSSLRLCVALEIMSAEALIQTHTINIWRQKRSVQSLPSLHKKNCVFLLGGVF